VSGNLCVQNDSGTKAGIFALGDRNRIEGNHLTLNDMQLRVNGQDNLVARNTACGTNLFDVAAGNQNAPWSPVASNTHPWGNIILCETP